MPLALLVGAVLGLSCSATRAGEKATERDVNDVDAAAAEPAPQTLEALEASLQSVLEETHTPGLIAAVVEGDRVVWEGTLGFTDSTHATPISRRSRFRLGSVTKMFTSVAALLLVERGAVSLDAKLAALAPEAGIENAWAPTDPVLLVHALEHTSGFDDAHLRDFALNDPDISLQAAVSYNTTSRRVRWRPGMATAYSNMGPAVAALALQKVAGEPFEAFVGREIFDALGMSHTSFAWHADVVPSFQADGVTPEPYVHIGGRPSGAIHSTAADMARFVRFLVQRGVAESRPILSPRSIRRMETPKSSLAARAGLRVGYGLGNSCGELNGFTFCGHGGAIDGFVSRLRYLPSRAGYFISINAANRQAAKRVDELMRLFVTRDLEPPPGVPAVIDPSLKSVGGYYEPGASRMELMAGLARILQVHTLEVGNSRITLKPVFGEAKVFVPLGGGKLRLVDERKASVVILEDPEGGTWLQGALRPLRNVSAARVWMRWGIAAYCVLLFLSSLVVVLAWPVWSFVVRRRGRTFPVRASPMLPSCFLAAAVVCGARGAAKGLPALAVPSVWSVGFAILTAAFALATAWSIAHLWIHRSDRSQLGRAKKLAWWYGCAVALAHAVLVAYLGGQGFIGLRTWAWERLPMRLRFQASPKPPLHQERRALRGTPCDGKQHHRLGLPNVLPITCERGIARTWKLGTLPSMSGGDQPPPS